jgi:hypothetical protein
LVRWTRRTASAVLAVTTVLALTAPAATAAPTTTEEPLEAAAGWLAERIHPDHGAVFYEEWDWVDLGGTIDVVLALGAAGVASDAIATATSTLEQRASEYAGHSGDGVRTGALGKLLLLAAATDRDPTAFGSDNLDLVTLLQELEDEDGRFVDEPAEDWSTPFTQALAIIGLERTASEGASEDAVDFLASQACSDGGFPLSYPTDPATCTSGADATALAAQALLAAGEDASDAIGWLRQRQQESGDGSVGGNSNSTGLAAQAFAEAGEQEELDAARAYLVSLQFGCEDDEPGAIDYGGDDPFADITKATAQAIPGLAGVGLASIDATTATSAVPAFDCASGDAPAGDAVDGEDAEEEEAGGQVDEVQTDAGTSADPAAVAEPLEGTEAEEGELPRTGGVLVLLSLLGATLVGSGLLLLRRSGARATA